MTIKHFAAAFILAAATTGVAYAQQANGGTDHILAHDPNPTMFTDMKMAKTPAQVDKAYVAGMTMMMHQMHMMAQYEMAHGANPQVKAVAQKELTTEHDVGDPLSSTRQRFFPAQMSP